MTALTYTDSEAAQALVAVLGDSPWVAAELARGYLALEAGEELDAAVRAVSNRTLSRRKCAECLEKARNHGFLSVLEARTDTGSSVNPITKLFPATVTEQRFLEEIDALGRKRPSVGYEDDRESGHTLVDFTLVEGDLALPINIKNAGTRFESARQLVDLDPDDCVPIPAYKAHAAVESLPTLSYVVSVDYTLVTTLDTVLPTLLSRNERITWDLLTRFKGSRIRRAEDAFILKIVSVHWEQLTKHIAQTPFHVVSARKAIKVLQDIPRRTPGIGLRAWGNRANAEVNVHLSIKSDMTPWPEVRDRLETNGIDSIITAINRRRQAWIYDPEI